MNNRSFLYTCTLTATIAATGLLTACSSTPRTDARLDAAHAKFTALQSQTSGSNLAPIELKDAQDALGRADASLRDRDDAEVVQHNIYLAQQRVAVAEQAYKRKVAEQSLSQLNDQRDQLRLQARTAEAERAKAELKDLQAKMTDRGVVMTLGDVLFDVGKATLKSGGVREVQKLAAYLKENSQRKVGIEGFTDSTGSEDSNQRLSERRAEAVKDALVNAGVEPERITVTGYGESSPIATNDTAAGRQLNRRVEVVLSDETGKVAPR